jgi:hypothetical protein
MKDPNIPFTGITKYCKQIEGDADDIFYLYDTPALKANGVVAIRMTKARGGKLVLNPIYLDSCLEYRVFLYNPENQIGVVNYEIDEISDGDHGEDYDVDEIDY